MTVRIKRAALGECALGHAIVGKTDSRRFITVRRNGEVTDIGIFDRPLGAQIEIISLEDNIPRRKITIHSGYWVSSEFIAFRASRTSSSKMYP